MGWMNRKTYINIPQIILDACCLVLTYIITVFLTGKVFRPVLFGDYLWVPVLFSMVYLFTMFICEMYHRSTFTYQDRTLRYILKSCILAAGFCLIMMPFVSKNNLGLDFLMLYLLSALVVISIQNIAMQEMRISGSKRWNKRAIFVGVRENIQEYLYYIKKTSFQVDVVGYVTLDESHIAGDKNLGDIKNLNNILNENIVDEVIFAMPCSRFEDVQPHVLKCRERGLTVKLAMDFFETNDSKSSVHTVGTIPVFTWQSANLTELQSLSKRIMDITGALIGLFLTVLVSIFIVPMILIQMGEPVFIRRTYLSLNGRPFTLLLFRTSSDKAEKNDDKTNPSTFIGRFLRRTGMDHLPMFWNVLKGDMSLVGSLPVPGDCPDGLTNYLWKNISIKPGLTGAWRFGEKEFIDDENYLAELNYNYADKWSLKRDIWLILKTVCVLFTKQSGMTLLTTMENNRGSEMKYYISRRREKQA